MARVSRGGTGVIFVFFQNFRLVVSQDFYRAMEVAFFKRHHREYIVLCIFVGGLVMHAIYLFILDYNFKIQSEGST